MYRSYWAKHLGVVVWGVTEVRDALALRQEMQRRADTTKMPLVMVMVFPEGMGIPSAEVREALREHGAVALQLCSRMTSVIEGTGVRASMFRTANRALLTVMGRANRVHTVSTLDEALRMLPPDAAHLRGEIESAMRRHAPVSALAP